MRGGVLFLWEPKEKVTKGTKQERKVAGCVFWRKKGCVSGTKQTCSRWELQTVFCSDRKRTPFSFRQKNKAGMPSGRRWGVVGAVCFANARRDLETIAVPKFCCLAIILCLYF